MNQCIKRFVNNDCLLLVDSCKQETEAGQRQGARIECAVLNDPSKATKKSNSDDCVCILCIRKFKIGPRGQKSVKMQLT